MRPDCCIRLPGDHRMMVVDAKFPLESFTALKAAAGDEAALRQAMARVRGDVGKHIKDIAERYLLPGETQDIAMMFVPSESLYAEINETFEDVVAKAHKARLIIVSPSLLMMAVQVMQAIVRDARVREQAHAIQNEVRHLIADVGRLHERVGKLGTHFRQVGEDVANTVVSADKVLKRGERIDAMDFSESAPTLPAGSPRRRSNWRAATQAAGLVRLPAYRVFVPASEAAQEPQDASSEVGGTALVCPRSARKDGDTGEC